MARMASWCSSCNGKWLRMILIGCQATLHFTHPCILETQFRVLIVHGYQPVTVENGSRSPSHPHNTFLVTFTQSSLIRNNLFLEAEWKAPFHKLFIQILFYFLSTIYLLNKNYIKVLQMRLPGRVKYKT